MTSPLGMVVCKSPNVFQHPFLIIDGCGNYNHTVCECHDHPMREWDATPKIDGAGSYTLCAIALYSMVWLSYSVVDVSSLNWRGYTFIYFSNSQILP